MKAEVLIIGAGAAGLTAAYRLAERGVTPLVIESDVFPGGSGAQLSCKALDSCQKCNACLLEDAAGEFTRAGLKVRTGVTITSMTRKDDGYLVRTAARPVFIDPEKCFECGLCLEKCPEAGRALVKSPLAGISPRFAVNPNGCLKLEGRDCRACVDVCPTGAIDLSAGESEEEFFVRGVIAAPGGRPFNPTLKPRLGYGRVDGVITALELENSLRRNGGPDGLLEGRSSARIAFIQCVGSRDKSLGRNYCSRICCGYALRLSRRLLALVPEAEISFFYMDIQNFGRDFDSYYAKVKDSVELIHGIPGELVASENGGVMIPFFNEASGRKESREYDLAVLSQGLGPPETPVCDLFGFSRNEDGFLRSHPPQGLFAVGTASGPMNLAEARADAEKAVLGLLEHLNGTL